MAVNVEIGRGHNESTASVIRKFTKRVQGSGILQRVRGLRYFERTPSKATRKKRLLISLSRKATYDEKLKNGLIVEKTPGSSKK